MKKTKLCTALPVCERHSDVRRMSAGTTVLSENNFKAILFLFLILFIAAPVFAVPGEYITLESGLVVCDMSDVQQLRQKLEKEFVEKHRDSGIRGNDHNKEVDLPVYKLLEQKRKLGHCGFQK